MKKLILLLSMAFVIAVAIAQTTVVETNKKIICNDTKQVLDTLLNEYNESPVWAGTNEKSKFSLLINQETGSWTMIQFDKDITCVLGIGEESRAINFGKIKPTL